MSTITILNDAVMADDGLKDWARSKSAAGNLKAVPTLAGYIRVVGISRQDAEQFQTDNGIAGLFCDRLEGEETSDYIDRMRPLLQAAFAGLKDGTMFAIWMTESDYQLLSRQPEWIAAMPPE